MSSPHICIILLLWAYHWCWSGATGNTAISLVCWLDRLYDRRSGTVPDFGDHICLVVLSVGLCLWAIPLFYGMSPRSEFQGIASLGTNSQFRDLNIAECTQITDIGLQVGQNSSCYQRSWHYRNCSRNFVSTVRHWRGLICQLAMWERVGCVVVVCEGMYEFCVL